VAGFICKYIFTEHLSTVTSLAVVGRNDGQRGTYLVEFNFSLVSACINLYNDSISIVHLIADKIIYL
jgi:hypothetical protein